MYCGIDPRGIKSKRAVRDLALAKALMYTCHEMYHRMVMHIPSYILVCMYLCIYVFMSKYGFVYGRVAVFFMDITFKTLNIIITRPLVLHRSM
jgi:hypothetical protein